MKKITKTIAVALAMALTLSLGAGVEADAATKVNKVAVSVQGVTTKKLTLVKGKKQQLQVLVNGTKLKAAQVKKQVTVKSKKPATVSVTKTGKLTAKKTGTAKIVVTSKKNKKKKATLTVTVVKAAKAATKVVPKAAKETLTVGETTTVSATVKHNKKKAASQLVAFKSATPKIASVNAKTGKVTALKAGTAKIKVTALDGSKKSATVTITVVAEKETVIAPKDVKDVSVKVEFTNAKDLQADVDKVAAVAVAKGEDIQVTLDGTPYTATWDGTNVKIGDKKIADSVKANAAKSVTVVVSVKADKIAAALAFAPASVTKVTVADVEFTNLKADSFTMAGKDYTYSVEGKNIVVAGDVVADFAKLTDYVTVTARDKK